MKKDIVVSVLAEKKKQIELCWQARSEDEAVNLCKYLRDHGIEAKAVALSHCKDWPGA